MKVDVHELIIQSLCANCKESVAWQGGGGAASPLAQTGGGRQNPAEEFLKMYIWRNFF